MCVSVEVLRGSWSISPCLTPLLSKEVFIPPFANPWLQAFIIRNDGIAAMRMSLDMTDMIIAFTANREITGPAENKRRLQACGPFNTSRQKCYGRSRVPAEGPNPDPGSVHAAAEQNYWILCGRDQVKNMSCCPTNRKRISLKYLHSAHLEPSEGAAGRPLSAVPS